MQFVIQLWLLATVLMATVFAALPARAGRLTAEPPEVSGGGEASAHPRMLEILRPGPYPNSPAGSRAATPTGVVGPTFSGFGFDDNQTENGFRTIPPGAAGAAGTDRLVAAVNSMIEARTKAGALLFRDALKDFYAPLAGCAPLSFPFDPRVVYDHYAGRFVVVALERTNAGSNPAPGNQSRILLAVSRTSTPATATPADWWFHCIDSKIASGGLDYWADFPGFEVDEEAVYITHNLFTFPGVPSAFGGSRLWIVHKGAAGGFYAGGPATATVHNPYVLAGSIPTTTMPAEVHGAGGAGPGIGTCLVSYSGITDGTDEYAQVIRVDDPRGTVGGPFFVGPDLVSLGNIELMGGGLPDAPQPGTAQQVEVNDRRALDAVWRGGALWLATTIVPDGPALPALADHTTAFWIRLDTSAVTSSASPAGLITLDQFGGIAGEEIAGGAGGPVYTYCPAVAVNADGTAAFGFAASGANVPAGAYATVRRAGDLAGATDPASTIRAGLDYYVRTFDGPPCDPAPARNRWGDCSGISSDPADDAAFWVYNGFADLRGSPSTGGCHGRPDPEDGRWGTAWGVVGVRENITLGNAGIAEGNPLGGPTLLFHVTVSHPSVAEIRVDYATVDGSATIANLDYVATSGTLVIAPGQVAATIGVPVNGDGTVEPNETLSIVLSNPVNVTVTPGGGLGTLYNDDGVTDVEGDRAGALALRLLTPNPGGASARLEFELPDAARITLSVLDVHGHRVALLADGVFAAGRHGAVWEAGSGARRIPRGVYFARLATPAGIRTQRIVLL